MNKKYAEHFLMKLEDVKAYAVEEVGFFEPGEPVEAEEIGDGNINYVFRIWNPDTNRSLVIKQADKLLRSSGRPLDTYRNKIEAEILKIEGQLAKGYVPEIYHYDEVMCALAMEDISAYKNLRKEMMEGKTFPHLPESIAEFLAKTLLPTTDLVLDRAEKKENVKKFMNPELCDITEDLVFTEPYYDYKGRNILMKEQQEFVEEMLYHNEEVKAEAAKLRERFMNCSQALIHGDLHTGSIFVNEQGIKVIDPEFAFYGPMGYDAGNVIGNLFFAWANKHYTCPDNREFLQWIGQAVEETADQFEKKLREQYQESVKFQLYQEEKFKEEYLHQVMADTYGYAGTEIIRRVVGDSKVAEVTAICDRSQRIRTERALVKIGIYLIMNRCSIENGKALRRAFELIIK